MAFSDCVKCWETPCSCGWGFREYSEARLSKYLASITQYRTKEAAKRILQEAINLVDKSSRQNQKNKDNGRT